MKPNKTSFRKGNKPKFSEEHKKNISKSLIGRVMPPRFDHNKVIELYQNGAPTKQICTELNVSRTSIYNVLEKNRISLRSHELTDDQIQSIKQDNRK